jgi:maltooligosyltrehalose trehalohydrolase
VFHQNHDQVGNRVKGDRLASLINFDLLKVAYAMLLLSPYVPLFFMGEEYGAETPFYFFADYKDEERRKNVNTGRQKEFEAFGWTELPPEPCDENTIVLCKLTWEERHKGKHKILLEWNKELIALRKTHATLQTFDKNNIAVNIIAHKAFSLHRKTGDDKQHLLALFNLTGEPIEHTVAYFNKCWKKKMDSGMEKWLQEDMQQATMFPDEISRNKLTLPPYSVGIYEAQ